MIGTLAAGTLGYIHGNTRGAIKAAHLYQKLNSMAPIPRKRKYSGVPVQRPAAKKHKSGMGKKFGLRRSAPKQLAINTQAAKVRGSAGNNKRRVKKVKVTAQFRKKVKKALEPALIKGKYLENSYMTNRFPHTFDNKQQVGTLGDSFTPSQVLDAASVLWNEKLPTNNKSSLNSQNFARNTVKINVINSYTTMHFKNNTRRTYTMKLYNCRSKIRDQLEFPITSWADALAVEAQPQGSNVLGIDVNTMYNDPRMVPNWNQQWHADVTTVTLEPGQIYDYFVQGPKNKLYDFAKYVTNSTPQLFTDRISDARSNFVVFYPDVVSTTIGTAGRYVDDNPADGDSDGLATEIKHYYQLSMPEQAGYLVGTAGGGTQALNLRKYSFAIFSEPGNQQTGVVRRVDDDNPVIVEGDL